MATKTIQALAQAPYPPQAPWLVLVPATDSKPVQLLGNSPVLHMTLATININIALQTATSKLKELIK